MSRVGQVGHIILDCDHDVLAGANLAGRPAPLRPLGAGASEWTRRVKVSGPRQSWPPAALRARPSALFESRRGGRGKGSESALGRPARPAIDSRRRGRGKGIREAPPPSPHA